MPKNYGLHVSEQIRMQFRSIYIFHLRAYLRRSASAHVVTWLFELPVTTRICADWRHMTVLALLVPIQSSSGGFAA